MAGQSNCRGRRGGRSRTVFSRVLFSCLLRLSWFSSFFGSGRRPGWVIREIRGSLILFGCGRRPRWLSPSPRPSRPTLRQFGSSDPVATIGFAMHIVATGCGFLPHVLRGRPRTNTTRVGARLGVKQLNCARVKRNSGYRRPALAHASAASSTRMFATPSSAGASSFPAEIDAQKSVTCSAY